MFKRTIKEFLILEIIISRQDVEGNFKPCLFVDVEQLMDNFADKYGHELIFTFETKYNMGWLIIEEILGESTYRWMIEGRKAEVVALFKQLVDKINDVV